MIVGKGLIAKSLKNIDSEKTIFFASGVSNSLETRGTEFEREFTLLQKCISENPEKKLIYFSTLSINDRSKQNSHYVQHKLKIEKYIQKNCKEYLILRIGNIVGNGGNPNTLFNFLKSKIEDEISFQLHTKARRLFIDIDDISVYLEKNTNLKNEIINIAYPHNYDLKTVVNGIQSKISKEANYKEINDGDFYQIDFCPHVKNFFKNKSPEEYLQELISKYI